MHQNVNQEKSPNLDELIENKKQHLNKAMEVAVIYSDIATEKTSEPDNLNEEDSIRLEAVRALYTANRKMIDLSTDFAKRYAEGEFGTTDPKSMDDAFEAYLKREHNTSSREMQGALEVAQVNVDRVFGLPTQKSPETK
ncbi:hypothetical protein [Vibrio sp. 10N.239.312.D08]|uniref:hypothetical protein n=1 Tax=Vibrio sp. 10N.239.312.D08 TaxID=3229978 RepID=UPI00354F7232